VVLGSHNLGFKASYSNDENFLIVSGDKELALAYAVATSGLYDHYRFRANPDRACARRKKPWSGIWKSTRAGKGVRPAHQGRSDAVLPRTARDQSRVIAAATGLVYPLRVSH